MSGVTSPLLEGQLWGYKRDEMQEASTYGRYEVGGSGGYSGPCGGRGIPECFGEEGPHHSVAGEKQPTTQQPQRDVQLEDEGNLKGNRTEHWCFMSV